MNGSRDGLDALDMGVFEDPSDRHCHQLFRLPLLLFNPIPKALLRRFYWLAYRVLKIYWMIAGGRVRGAAVVVSHQGQIVLVRTSYRQGLELPGGGIKPQETAIEAACRELDEELGLSIAPEQLAVLLKHDFSMQGKHVDETVFLADVHSRPDLNPDQTEIISATWFDTDQILACLPNSSPHYPDHNPAHNPDSPKPDDLRSSNLNNEPHLDINPNNISLVRAMAALDRYRNHHGMIGGVQTHVSDQRKPSH